MRMLTYRNRDRVFEPWKCIAVDVDEERKEIMIICPNCRCHIDASSTVCMYCGLVLKSAAPKRQEYRNTIPEDAAYRSQRAKQRKQQRISQMYLQIIILLLCLLVILQMIEIIALLLG